MHATRESFTRYMNGLLDRQKGKMRTANLMAVRRARARFGACRKANEASTSRLVHLLYLDYETS